MNKLRNMLAGMSERERRLAALMGGIFLVFVVFLIIFLVGSKKGDLEDREIQNRAALSLLRQKGPEYERKKTEALMSGQKQRGKPMPLRTLIDNIGKQVNVTVPDMKELPDQKHGAGWVEHGIDLSMREVGLLTLTRFMEEVEGYKKRFPIAITKLEIRTRRRTPDSYDVRMVVSTYEQEPEQLDAVGRAGAAKRGGR